ncbi:MAG: ATP-binding protein [Deltaproteobacteria bacterium]|nr:ATP-binding protein [Deltaproteobacteria bacterium]
MIFVSGPRQVGKTTTCRNVASSPESYLDWDNSDDRRIILRGPAAITERLKLSSLREKPQVVILDEIHKFSRWKTLLKGFYDTYSENVRILITGSSRLDSFRRGGDSLMGRYFHYRMHPFSIAEIVWQSLPNAKKILHSPKKIATDDFTALWEHRGFPEPFIKRDYRFTRRWWSLRRQQLVREDIRDLTQVRELSQIEVLTNILIERSGEQLIYGNLAAEIQVSADTLRRWINTLCSLHFGFLIRPWFKNITRSLRKEPKWFLRDWSNISDAGKRGETFVACHLFKAVEGWTDFGFGDFQLSYLRDKNKREVDFLITRDNKPWILVEVKTSETSLSPSLEFFRKQTQAPYTFQVIINANFVNADCFAQINKPMVVPAKTFLSQLL